MCQEWIESIRLEDGILLNLDYHQKRMTNTFLCFDKSKNLHHLSKIVETLELPSLGIYKLRIVYDLEIVSSITIEPYEIKELKSFTFIESNDIEYSFKYSDRSNLDEIKKKAHTDEIIITQDGYLTDTSYSNLVFYKDGVWYTPTSYLLNGTMRQSLLNSSKIKVTDITLSNLKDFTSFKMINAMMPLDKAVSYPIELLLSAGIERSFL